MTTTTHHRHVCIYCGCEWRHSRRWILGCPLTGELKGRRLIIPADGNLVVAGYGPSLRDNLRNAPWVHEFLLNEGELYGFCWSYGPIKVCAPGFPQLREYLGDDFVRVRRSILVSATACLVPDIAEGIIGLAAGCVDGSPVLHWLTFSRRYRKDVECLLPSYHRHTKNDDDEPQTPAT